MRATDRHCRVWHRENVRGKGVAGVSKAVANAGGKPIKLELAALRTKLPPARAAWGQQDDASGSNDAQTTGDEQAGSSEQGAAAAVSSDAAEMAEAAIEGGSEGTVVVDAAPATSSRSRKRKSAASKRNQSSGGSQAGGGDGSVAGKARCEVCRCSVKQAMAAVRKRSSAEVSSAFSTGFREGYCCDCYDKLVVDIKNKKAAQAERERAKAAAKKKEDEEQTAAVEEAEAAQKASQLPTLDDHFRAHGVEAYSMDSEDPAAVTDSEESGSSSDDGGKGGRGVRALRKFPAAVTVWSEPPYVALLRYERWGARCQSCFMTAAESTAAAASKAGSAATKQRKLSACSRCGCVKYCCRDCQKADWSDHKHECAVLKRRANSTSQADRREDTIDADILMARIWRRRTKPGSTNNPRKDYPQSFAYSDIEEEQHLQSHEEGFAKELRADTVSQLPFISSFCPSSKGPAALTAEGLGDIFGRYCTNAFSTYTELMEACALAVYLGLALVNHSCEPNCWTYFEHGKHVQVRTLRAIAPGASASEGSSSHPLGAPSSAPRVLSVPLCRSLGEAPCCANSALAPTECASLIWVCLCTACAGATGEPLTIAYVNPPATRFARQAELKTNYFFDCACERWVLYRLYRPALLALTLKTSRYRAMRWVAPVRGGRVVV
jgi:hypothetical protein